MVFVEDFFVSHFDFNFYYSINVSDYLHFFQIYKYRLIQNKLNCCHNILLSYISLFDHQFFCDFNPIFSKQSYSSVNSISKNNLANIFGLSLIISLFSLRSNGYILQLRHFIFKQKESK